ncbi:MbnB/TglH/ChrH family RiPP precursor modification enzyme [Actinocorallia aurea]
MSGPGIGIGWRPEIAEFVAQLPGLAFTEVIAESLHHPDHRLLELRDRGVAVIPHGVRLSLGGAEPVDPARIEHLARSAELVGAPLVSEHVAFVRAGGLEAGHLLPVPRSRDSLDVLVRNTAATMAGLGVPFAVEPIAAVFDWPDDDYTEGRFLTELLDRTGALLLLDVANVYANARNRGEDPVKVLESFPLERVVYCHVAGGRESEGLYHDTHTDPVPAEVLALVAEAETRCPPENRLGYLLERDGSYPPTHVLAAELDAIADAANLPRITGSAQATGLPRIT